MFKDLDSCAHKLVAPIARFLNINEAISAPSFGLMRKGNKTKAQQHVMGRFNFLLVGDKTWNFWEPRSGGPANDAAPHKKITQTAGTSHAAIYIPAGYFHEVTTVRGGGVQASDLSVHWVGWIMPPAQTQPALINHLGGTLLLLPIRVCRILMLPAPIEKRIQRGGECFDLTIHLAYLQPS